MKDQAMREMFNDMKQENPSEAWVSATRSRLLADVLGRQKRRRHTFMGWFAGGATAMAAALVLLLILMPGSGVSFAEVQRTIDRAQTVRFESTLTLHRDGIALQLSTAQSWADRSLGARLDVQAMGSPIWQIWLPLEGRPMVVDHVHEAVIPLDIPSTIDTRELLRFDPATLVQRLGRIVGDIEPIVRDTSASPTQLAGFRVPATAMGLSSQSTLELWVDVESRLPMRMTATVPLSARETVVWELDEFVWREPLDLGQLFLDVPTDYEVIEPLIVPEPSAAALSRTLWRFALLSNGRFPSSEMIGWESLAKLVTVAMRPVSSWSQLPKPLHTDQGQRDAVGDAIAGGLFYIYLRESGAAPMYAGQNIRLGEEAPLLSWTQRDGSTAAILANFESEKTP